MLKKKRMQPVFKRIIILYACVAKAAVKKMKKAEEDYRSLLMRHKEAKCEIEKLNGEFIRSLHKSEIS